MRKGRIGRKNILNEQKRGKGFVKLSTSDLVAIQANPIRLTFEKFQPIPWLIPLRSSTRLASVEKLVEASVFTAAFWQR